MKKPIKKHSAVIEAESALKAKTEEIEEAKRILRVLETERASAYENVKRAQLEADSELPQCRIVRIGWRSWKEESTRNAVILRKTKSGRLVVRYVGDTSGTEMQFKLSKYSNAVGSFPFQKVEKMSFASDSIELRDVPDEYMTDTIK